MTKITQAAAAPRYAVAMVAHVVRSAALVALSCAALAIAPALPTASARSSLATAPQAHASQEEGSVLEDVIGLAKSLLHKTSVKTAKHALAIYIGSNATSCVAHLPTGLPCLSKVRPPAARTPAAAAGAIWGWGEALPYNGSVPAEKSSPFLGYQRGALKPGITYWLTCWAHGLSGVGPEGRTTIWYRLTNGTYVNAAWLYTSIPDYSVIAGVAAC